MAPVVRPAGPAGVDAPLVLVDGTSGAAGLPLDAGQCDVYYFAPQKGFASDGGLWLALVSPAAIERIERVGAERPTVAGERWVPDFLSLPLALTNSRKDQTYNTPALATLLLLADQLEWMLGLGGLEAMVGSHHRVERAPVRLGAGRAPRRHRSWPTRPGGHSWSGRSTSTRRSTRPALAATLRANGIVDVEPYRSLGRNQLRIAMFPATDPSDVQALTACIDYVLDRRV